MKKRLILTLATVFSVVSIYSQNGFNLKNMHLFPEGELIDSSNATIDFRPFYLSAQVTNIEFREFWDFIKANPDDEFEWVEISKSIDDSSKPQPTVKKIKHSELAKISFNQEDRLSDDYFESEKYNHSPVMGVSNDLKFYFCLWLTNKFNADLAENNIDSSSNFYLPSDFQIEYAKKAEPSFFTKNERGFRVAITK